MLYYNSEVIMREKKHYNNGVPIALTFPVSEEQKHYEELSKEMEKELAKIKSNNEKLEQALAKLDNIEGKDNK